MTITTKRVGSRPVQRTEQPQYQEERDIWQPRYEPSPEGMVRTEPAYNEPVQEERGVVTKVKDTIKQEAGTIWALNSETVKQGMMRAGIRKARVAIRDELRNQLGQRYVEFVESSELGKALEQTLLWNIVALGGMHFEGKIPGAKAFAKFGQEALTQTHEESGERIMDMAGEIVLKGIMTMKENIPELDLFSEEEEKKEGEKEKEAVKPEEN